jgi:ribosome maturation factor RimP
VERPYGLSLFFFFGQTQMDANNRIDTRTQIRSLVEPTIEAEGFRLIAVQISGDVSGDIVRLYCEGNDFGIDDCARISRALSPVLDVEDPMGGPYRLEVSSPGIERPIQSAADFERFAGFRAKLRLIPGPERRRYSGELRGFEDGNILIDIDGELQLVALDLLDWGHLVLDLDEFSSLQATLAADEKLEGAQS